MIFLEFWLKLKQKSAVEKCPPNLLGFIKTKPKQSKSIITKAVKELICFIFQFDDSAFSTTSWFSPSRPSKPFISLPPHYVGYWEEQTQTRSPKFGYSCRIPPVWAVFTTDILESISSHSAHWMKNNVFASFFRFSHRNWSGSSGLYLQNQFPSDSIVLVIGYVLETP